MMTAGLVLALPHYRNLLSPRYTETSIENGKTVFNKVIIVQVSISLCCIAHKVKPVLYLVLECML